MTTPLDPHLLRAILDEPDDDGARLAASDWWEEHGDHNRAERLRVGLGKPIVEDMLGHTITAVDGSGSV